ncbi:ATP-binding protein [Deinococcus hopiensis]|nr:ATP-binding protein [Deinococcus hopiensis]
MMSQPPKSPPLPDTHDVFVGDGEMSARMRVHNWAATSLGPSEAWPQSLKTIIRTMLTSRFAMWMAWGEDLTFFCNDAYLPTLGVKGDWALGARADVVWAEIWKDIGPRIAQVLGTGRATWDEGLMLFLERSGFQEETYHTFSYSPVADDAGRTAGMLCVVTEESERVVGERRLRTLRDLAARMSEARTTRNVLAAVEACLDSDGHDLPFALIYLADEDGPGAHLVSVAGSGAPTRKLGEAWPLEVTWDAPDSPPFSDLAPFGPLPAGSWDQPPAQALALPLARPGQVSAAGVLVAGLNPYRPLDEGYRGFLGLFAGQVATGLASANAYEEERRRAEALAELDRAKTTFFSNVSHEFRTPLTLMLGPLEELLSRPGALAPDQRREVEVTHRNAQRLLKLVNTMLDFTRIEAGRAEATFEPTDLTAFTADLASAFRSLVEGAGLRLRVDCGPLGEPAYVDRTLWEKVVLNLLSNAFKFTFHGEIHVTLRREGGRAVLSVADTGTGIPEAELPRVFERFHRVEGARGRSFEGTGIGLALVRELVGLHGGLIGVTSAVGEGTTFTVELPLGHAHLPAERVSDAARAPGGISRTSVAFLEEAAVWGEEAPGLPEASTMGGAQARILLADDNADLRDYVRRLLGDAYDVQAVPDGAQALEAARGWAPDLVLSDVMMPNLDGFGLLAALREDPALRHVPVILLSARAGEEARLGGLEAGADDYLVKPFSARELRSRVTTHLELARLRREAAARELGARAELERRVALRTAELEERNAALDAFARFSEAVGTTTDLGNLAHEAIEVLRARFGDASVAVYALENGLWKARVHSEDMSPEVVRVVTAGLPADLPVFAQTARKREPLFIDAWDPERGGVENSQEYGTTSLYPLVVDGEVPAMLSTAFKSKREWTEPEKAVVRAVGRGLTLALERGAAAARLAAQNEALDARTRFLEGFAALTRDLSIVDDPVALVPRAQQLVLPLVPGGYAAYYEPEIADGVPRWHLRSQVGDRRDAELQAAVERGLHLEETRSLFQPWSTGEAYYVSEYDPGTDRFGGFRARRGALAALPVFVNGTPRGVFGIVSFQPRDWSAAERAVLETVVRSLGLAMERALSVAQLARRTRELERSNQELEQFAYVASHDLQEPLRTVTSFSQLLTTRYAAQLDDQAQVYAGHITRGTERMARLIQDLLAFSRVGTREAPAERVDTARIVAEVVLDLGAQIGATGARVVVDGLPFVLGNATLLRQVFQNLLGNALKFCAPGRLPEVRVSGERRGGMVQFDVRDNGIGIESEYHERIFAIFQRLHHRDQYEGSGIGLAVARKIIERHGGRMWLTSTPGEGSTFSFTLPTVH